MIFKWLKYFIFLFLPLKKYWHFEYRLIKSSLLFDESYYLGHSYLANCKIRDSLLHYLVFGQDFDIEPTPLFNSRTYRTHLCFKKSQSRLTPLGHFIKFGRELGLDPCPDFNTAFYLSKYPDIADSKINPLYHYLKYGIVEGRLCIDISGISEAEIYMSDEVKPYTVKQVWIDFNRNQPDKDMCWNQFEEKLAKNSYQETKQGLKPTVRCYKKSDSLPIKVIMFSHNLDLQGASISQFDLTVGLRDAGIILPIVVSVHKDGPLKPMYESQGIKVIDIFPPYVTTPEKKNLNEVMHKFTYQLKDIDADLIYANTVFGLQIIDAADRLGRPCIWNIRESSQPEELLPLFGKAIGKVMKNYFAIPYQVVFVSNSTRKNYEVFNTKFNFSTINNALNVEEFDQQLKTYQRGEVRKSLRISDSSLMIILVGTICERKAQLDLIDACSFISPDVLEKCKIFFIGDRGGEYSYLFHKEVEKLPDLIKSKIEIVKETSQIYKYYCAADISICTSRVESYPRIILESMYCGLAIITTPVFGIKEQIIDGRNGIFYSPGDIPDFANKLNNVIKSETLRKKLGENARIDFSDFPTYEEVINNYSQLFREAVYTTKFK